MIRAFQNEKNEEYLVIFEILAENLKNELDNILKANHQYKTDYYRFNRKKFLLSYCFDPNNANNQYEINAYLDEIKRISSTNDFDKCFKEAHNLITSTTSFVHASSNKLLDKIKFNFQRINTHQANSFDNYITSNSNPQNVNLPVQIQMPQTSTSQYTPTLNQILNRNHVNNTNPTQEPPHDSYFSREISFFNQVENLANNIALETYQLADIVEVPHSQVTHSPNLTHVIHENQNVNKEKPHHNRQIPMLASGKRFKCEVCSKEFNLKHHWQNHMRTHTGEKPYICEFCGRAFSDQSSFSLHIKLKHTDRSSLKHECKDCGKRFSALSYLKKHVVYHGERSFKCDQCTTCFYTLDQLKRHLTLHTGEKPFECELCKRKFRLKRTLRNHIITHNGERPFSCSQCDKSYSSKEYLQGHMKTHTKKNLKTCDICNKSFITNQALNNHLLLHKEERNFVCDIDGCKKSFKTPGNLSEHRMTHSKDAKKFACPHCDKRFYQKSKLKRHSAKHSDVMSYECQVESCKEKFKTSWSLYQHKLKFHKEGQEFKCSECDKSFISRDKLKRHAAVHSKVNSFECNICNERFHTTSNLYYHKSKHKENEALEKVRLKCDQCDKTFAKKDGLKKHKAAHIETKSFTCDICSKIFKSKGNLTEHRLTHSEEAKKFQCPSCPAKFYQLSKLKRHEVVHKGKYACDECDERFKFSRLLNLHKKTHGASDEIVADSNSDLIDLEHSSDENEDVIGKSVKETSAKKSVSNNSRRKANSPKKIKISFSKSTK